MADDLTIRERDLKYVVNTFLSMGEWISTLPEGTCPNDITLQLIVATDSVVRISAVLGEGEKDKLPVTITWPGDDEPKASEEARAMLMEWLVKD